MIKDCISHFLIPNPNPEIELLGLNIECADLSFNFFSYYNPSNKILNLKFLKSKNETTNFLLVGDLNARTTCIGCKADTASGKILSDYLMNSDSVVINDSSNTLSLSRIMKKNLIFLSDQVTYPIKLLNFFFILMI